MGGGPKVNENRSFLHMMSWRLVLDVLSRGTFFVINVLIARSLGVSDFGKFAYAVSLTQIFYIFTDLGIGVQVMKEQGESSDANDTKWIDFFELKIVLMAICSIAFLAISFSFWKWEKPWLLMLAFVWMLSNSLLDFNQYIANGLSRHDVARSVMVSQRACTIAGVALPLLFFPTLEGVLWGLAVGGTAGSLLSNWRAHRLLGVVFAWRGNAREWGRILRTALPFGAAAAFGLWYIRVGGVLIAWYWSSQVVGEYGAAFRVFEITYLFPAAIMAVSIPRLSASLQKGRPWFLHDLSRLSAGMVGSAALWTAFLFFGNNLLVYVLFGEGFSGAAPYLAGIAAAGGLVFLTYLATSLMVVFNLQKRHALNEWLAFIVGFLLNVALIPSHGAYGAIYALMGTEIFRLTITSASLFRQWRLWASVV